MTSFSNVKEGYLTKMGGSGIQRNWRRRFFTLKQINNDQEFSVSYFKTNTDKQPLGVIQLSEYTSVENASQETGKNNCIKLFNNVQPTARIYYMFADNQEEMHSWIQILQQSFHSNKVNSDQIPKRITAEVDPAMRDSFEQLDVDNARDHVKSVLQNLSHLKTDIEEKRAKIDLELKQAEKMRKEIESLKVASQDEWQRLRSYSQKLINITNSLQEHNPVSDSNNSNLSLIVEEWMNIEQSKKEASELRLQAQQLFEHAQNTVALIETAKHKLEQLQVSQVGQGFNK